MWVMSQRTPFHFSQTPERKSVSLTEQWGSFQPLPTNAPVKFSGLQDKADKADKAVVGVKLGDFHVIQIAWVFF